MPVSICLVSRIIFFMHHICCLLLSIAALHKHFRMSTGTRSVVNILIDHLPRNADSTVDTKNWRYVLLHRFYNELMTKYFDGDELEPLSV